ESNGLTSALVEDLPEVSKQQMFQMTENTSEINTQAEYDELALQLASHFITLHTQNIKATSAPNYKNPKTSMPTSATPSKCLRTSSRTFVLPNSKRINGLGAVTPATSPSALCSEVLPLSAEVSRAQVDRESKLNRIVAARFIHSNVSISIQHKSFHPPVEILEMLLQKLED
ncbi:hypothetical protein BGZ90_008179, partial [Linnemannia elongata]